MVGLMNIDIRSTFKLLPTPMRCVWCVRDQVCSQRCVWCVCVQVCSMCLQKICVLNRLCVCKRFACSTGRTPIVIWSMSIVIMGNWEAWECGDDGRVRRYFNTVFTHIRVWVYIKKNCSPSKNFCRLSNWWKLFNGKDFPIYGSTLRPSIIYVCKCICSTTRVYGTLFPYLFMRQSVHEDFLQKMSLLLFEKVELQKLNNKQAIAILLSLMLPQSSAQNVIEAFLLSNSYFPTKTTSLYILGAWCLMFEPAVFTWSTHCICGLIHVTPGG